jgi:hypothetical protein
MLYRAERGRIWTTDVNKADIYTNDELPAGDHWHKLQVDVVGGNLIVQGVLQ